MHTPFVLELQADDNARAARVAEALARELRARHVGVRREGGADTQGDPLADLVTTPPGAAGTWLRVGVRTLEGEPRWLRPMRLDAAPEEAARDAVAFLERWGFVTAPDAPRGARSNAP